MEISNGIDELLCTNYCDIDNIIKNNKYNIQRNDKPLNKSNCDDVRFCKSIVDDIFDKAFEFIDKKQDEKPKNITLERLQQYFNVDFEDNILSIDNDKYYYKCINNNFYIGDVKDNNNAYDAIRRLKNVIKHKDIIIAINFKEVGIIETKNINTIKDISASEILTSYKYKDFSDKVFYSYYNDFEISIKKDKWLNINIIKIKDKLININKDIIKLCKLSLNYDIDIKKIFISEASGDDEKKEGYYKISYHISFPIYVREIEQLYEVFQYLNYNIYKLDKNSFKTHNLIDKKVYLKSSDGSRKWRMLNQSKLGLRKLKTVKIEDFGYTEDVNIFNCIRFGTYFNKDFINIEKIREFLYKNIEKNNIKLNDDTTYYDALEVLNLNIKKTNRNILLSYDDVIDLFKNEENTNAIVKTYLKTIQNTEKTIQSYEVWDKIKECLRNIGLKYYNDINYYLNEFRLFTLKAYSEKNKKKCNENIIRIWNTNYDNHDENKKIGLITLQNIVLRFDKEVHLKIILGKEYNILYNLSPEKLGFDEYIITDINERLNFKKEFLDNYKTIFIKLNVGEGKTEATNKLSLNYDYYICISNRVLYAVDLKSKIEKLYNDYDKKSVISYLDDKNKSLNLFENKDFTLENSSTFITSFESLTKFLKFIIEEVIDKNKTFCLFLDEFEALFNNIIGSTNNNPESTLQSFIILWKRANIKIIADAFLSYKSIYLYNVLNKLGDIENEKPLIIHANNRNLYPKTYNIVGEAKGTDEKEDLERIISIDLKKHITNGKKVLMFCEYAKIIEHIKQSLENYGVTKDVILAITAKIRENATPEDLNKMIHYLKNPDDLVKILIFIYNTSILNGFSFTKEHFNKGIITLGSFGVSANDALNASSRARCLYEFFVYIMSYESKMKALMYYPIDNSIIKKQIENKHTALYCNKNETYNIEEIIKLNKYLKLVDDGTVFMNIEYIENDGNYLIFYNFKKQLNLITKEEEDVFNELFRISHKQYNEYDNENIIYLNKYKIAINKLFNFRVHNDNLNSVFKYEIFKRLIKDTNNILIEDDNNIVELFKKTKNIIETEKTEEIDEVEVTDELEKINDNKPIKKSIRKEAFENYLEQHKDLDEYGVFNLKSCYDIVTTDENNKKTSYYICNKIINNYKSIDKYSLNDLWAFCDCCYVINNVVDNLISIKYNKNRDDKTFHYKYIKDLLEILNISLKDLASFNITNLYVKEQKLYEKIKEIANMSRRFYGRNLSRDLRGNGDRDKTPLQCIKDINEILSPLHLELIEDKTKTIKKTLSDKSRFNIITYYIVTKYDPEIQYKFTNNIIKSSSINIFNILEMFIEEEIKDVNIEDEDDNIKYSFIPDDDIEEDTNNIIDIQQEIIKPKLREAYIKKRDNKEIIEEKFKITSDKKDIILADNFKKYYEDNLKEIMKYKELRKILEELGVKYEDTKINKSNKKCYKYIQYIIAEI